MVLVGFFISSVIRLFYVMPGVPAITWGYMIVAVHCFVCIVRSCRVSELLCLYVDGLILL